MRIILEMDIKDAEIALQMLNSHSAMYQSIKDYGRVADDFTRSVKVAKNARYSMVRAAMANHPAGKGRV